MIIFYFNFFIFSSNYNPSLGFFRLKLLPNETNKLNLKQRTLTLIDVIPGSFSFTITPYNSTLTKEFNSIPIKYLSLEGQEIKFDSNSLSPIEIPIWLLPPDLCKGSKSMIIAERYINMMSHSTNFNGEICIFSQSIFKKTKTLLKVETPDENVTVSFFTTKSLTFPELDCIPGTLCQFESTSPFFLHINGAKEKSMIISMEHTVINPANNIYHCSVPPIARIEDSTIIQSSTMLGDISFRCVSLARDMLSIIHWGGLFIGSLIFIILFLHFTGIINFILLCCPDDEKMRFENLKKDPYVQPIESSKIENKI